MRKEKKEELNSYIEEFKTKEKERINSPSFIKVETYQCTLNNGKIITRDKILKGAKTGSASIVLPITKEGNIVLTIQPRVFTKTTIGIAFPAGYREENESYEEAAKRELEEETGYIAKEYIEVCSYYQDDGCSAALNHAFIATDCEKKAHQKLDSSEYIHYMEVTKEELEELIKEGYICDGNSLLLYEKYKDWREKHV